jgi:type I restriction enzyme S subunit
MNIEGWTNSSLISLLDVMKSGGTPNTSRSDFYGGEIPFVSIEDMSATRKYLQHTVKTLTKEGLKNSNTWLVPENSLLYSIYATLGLVRISKVTLATNQAILAMIVNPKVIDQEYLYYWLEYVRDSVINLSSQTTQRNLNATTVKTFIVQHPENKKEQKQIAEILSTIDRAIAKTEAIIAKQQRIKTGLMQDLLTKGIDENGNIRSEATHKFKDSAIGRIPVEWEMISMDKITTKIVDGIHHTPNYVQEGIPFIVVTDLTSSEGINFTPSRFITEKNHQEFYKRADPKAKDVLVTKDGTLGVARIVPDEAPDFSIFVSVAMLRPKTTKCISELIWSFFESGRFLAQLGSLSAGTGLAHIHLEHFRKFQINLMPIDEQKRIFEVLNHQQLLLQKQSQNLEKLKHQKTGLMQDLLTGKVRVISLNKE